MAHDERKALMTKVESLREGRALVCYFNFDRESDPRLPGVTTQFSADSKEALFRVLKESKASEQKIDLCLYTRGGDLNAVWPLVNLLREFDFDFDVLAPFRCHSSGTLVALGARRILMAPLSELSPIDPSTGNQFNPSDPAYKSSRLPISVEDVQAYSRFVADQHKVGEQKPSSEPLLPEQRGMFLRG